MTNEVITLDKQQLQQIEQLSNDMSRTALAIPKHLQGNPAACKAVVRNSIRWGMDPYLVAAESSDIKGKLMYSGKLVNAVVSEDPRLEFPLDFEFEGAGENMICTVIGKLKGEGKERRVNVPMPPQNKRVSDHWRSNQEQQLSYYAARVWTRRHLPGKLLGVWTPEDPHSGAYDHRPAKEVPDIMQNVERVANGEEPVEEVKTDEDVIEGVAVQVEEEPKQEPFSNIRLIKSDGTQIDFDSFTGMIEFMEVNLPKINDMARLDSFEETHRAIFQEYVHAGHSEWAMRAAEIIQEHKERINNVDTAI